MTPDEGVKGLLEIVEGLDTRLDIVAKELDDIHVEWQRDRGIHIRLAAQIEALVSLLAELASRSEVAPAHVEACFQERYLHFQDKELREIEKASADLAAHIDSRREYEVPTEPSFRPLFQ